MLNQETSNINGEIETWRRAFDGESMKEDILTVCALCWQINLIVLSLKEYRGVLYNEGQLAHETYY